MGSCFYCSEQKVSPYCSQKLKSLFITLFLLHFLFRVLSGIRTTHRQPSLIIETGNHTKTNQDPPFFVQSSGFLFISRWHGSIIREIYYARAMTSRNTFCPELGHLFIFLYLQPSGKVLTKVKRIIPQVEWIVILILFDSFHYQVWYRYLSFFWQANKSNYSFLISKYGNV